MSNVTANDWSVMRKKMEDQQQTIRELVEALQDYLTFKERYKDEYNLSYASDAFAMQRKYEKLVAQHGDK